MSLLATTISSGWPESRTSVHHSIQEFWPFRDELVLFLQDGLILKGDRVVVPAVSRPDMLQRLHAAHRGVEYTLRLARDAMFWPRMSHDVTTICTSCPTCASYPSQLPREPMLSHPVPTLPWQYVSQDLFCLDGRNYLVTVDHFSGFYEVDLLPDTSASTVIAATKSHFARHGIPATCVTDNGPQFTSGAYAGFAVLYGFHHVTSSPYWSQSNGRAEAAVKDAKSILRKAGDPYLALLLVRNTPPRGHAQSPAQRLFGRRTRSQLPVSPALLYSISTPVSSVTAEIHTRRAHAARHYNRRAGEPHNMINVGDMVYAKPNPTHRGQSWICGRVIARPTPRSYVIDTGVCTVRRNRA